jgi:biopolymer transport protein ExbB/biopolymer transport protein TolQ
MSRLSTLLGAALLVGGLMVSPAWSQQKKNDAVAEAAVKEAVAQVARLQSARDSLSRLRWSLRQTGLDARERWQAEQERVRDSLDKAASERVKLLEEVRETRERAAHVKPGPDAVTRQREQLRQEMLDRAEMLRDKVRYGLPWDTDVRTAAILRVMRGIESYATPREGLAPLIGAYLAEWDFSRQIEKQEGEFPRAVGGTALGTRVRVGTLGAWYLTRENVTGLLARSGTGDMPYGWHENLLPPTQRAILTGIGSRALELPVDPMQTQASGPGYFVVQEKSLLAKLFDLKDGPLAKMPLLLARAIIILLIGLGLGCLILFIRRRALVKREAADADAMRLRLFNALTKRQSADTVVGKADVHTVAGRIVRLGFDNKALAPEALEQLMISQESVEERRLNRGLTYLGTVASNAAFIGLLGTVLGILDAFAHLGGGEADAALQVMSAIAEALVATALGLAVAIPAVVFYNVLSHNVGEVMDEAREMRHLILAAGLDTAARAGQDAGKAVPQKETARESSYGG